MLRPHETPTWLGTGTGTSSRCNGRETPTPDRRSFSRLAKDTHQLQFQSDKKCQVRTDMRPHPFVHPILRGAWRQRRRRALIRREPLAPGCHISQLGQARGSAPSHGGGGEGHVDLKATPRRRPPSGVELVQGWGGADGYMGVSASTSYRAQLNAPSAYMGLDWAYGRPSLLGRDER